MTHLRCNYKIIDVGATIKQSRFEMTYLLGGDEFLSNSLLSGKHYQTDRTEWCFGRTHLLGGDEFLSVSILFGKHYPTDYIE